ncbi:MAG: hypothetical protein F6J98_05505 [Moorea sp. SIO4G2]|nr:hypothetical protein [Moorena sp. SIO4G2]
MGSLKKDSTTTPNEANSLLPTPYSLLSPYGSKMFSGHPVDIQWTLTEHPANGYESGNRQNPG